MLQSQDALIKSVLIKLTARCNLNCDYCYVFNHIDQSWKSLPAKMSIDCIHDIARRIAEYTSQNKIPEFLCIFHGGEPLLLGSDNIVKYKQIIQEAVGGETKLFFSLQTNGVLLRQKDLEIFAKENIGISMSLDGPKEVQDLHRLSHSGASSYNKAKRGIDLLKKYPSIFEGVIAVIDPRTDPRPLLDFFSEISPPSCDFLLPDSNHDRKPFLKDQNENLYKEWLIKCFDTWIEDFPQLRIRFFDNLCEAILTGVSNTEAFGFGDVSLLSIETDGSFHDTDIFKTTKDGFSRLGLNVRDHSFKEAATTDKIKAHRRLLQMEGLSNQCKECSVVEICAGGCLQHRYSSRNEFDNPSVYCDELFTIINHISDRLQNMILADDDNDKADKIPIPVAPIDPIVYNQPTVNSKDFDVVYHSWTLQCLENFSEAINYASEKNKVISTLEKDFNNLSNSEKIRLSTYPSAVLWARLAKSELKNLPIYDLDDKRMYFDPTYLSSLFVSLRAQNEKTILIHEDDLMLRSLFGKTIFFEQDLQIIERGKSLTLEATRLIQDYSPGLWEEILRISPCIQFIVDPTAHPEKLVSFSDDKVPGCLYICIRHKKGFASVEDIADSIIHEHRHQKLYLLDSYSPIVLENSSYVKSPWREELRPVSGVFHGLFVFYELTKFWKWLYSKNIDKNNPSIKGNIIQNLEMMDEAITTLKTCSLSHIGEELLKVFEEFTTFFKQDDFIRRENA
jgi:uncharacterized protein